MDAEKQSVSRRDFLFRISLAAAAAPVLVSFRSPGSITNSRAHGASLECPDTELSAEQVKTRDGLQYVDASPHEDKRCNNCRLFQPPAEEAVCGGCQVVPGPIHPNGYCIAWSLAE